jgi:hypothetical protein
MDALRVSAKTLGLLALPTYCPRCFWIRVRLRGRLPFSIFPGIFSSIDAYSKAVTHGSLAATGVLPQWIAERYGAAVPIAVPHHSQFQFTDDETGVTLSGVPDEIIRCSRGGFVVLDYKTARHTDAADALAPMYEVQLACYCLIAERIGIAPVIGLTLVYFEPLGFDRRDATGLVDDRGFSMRFVAKLVPVYLDAVRIVPPLLQRAREISGFPQAPSASSNCRDCAGLDALVRLVAE